jgi:hypothetical protein
MDQAAHKETATATAPQRSRLAMMLRRMRDARGSILAVARLPLLSLAVSYTARPIVYGLHPAFRSLLPESYFQKYVLETRRS